MITERLMEPGQWAARLKPATPPSVLRAIEPFGHFITTSVYVPPGILTDPTLKGLARYAGIVRRRRWATGGQFDISGPGLAAWLGNENGIGRVFTTSTSHTNGTLSTWVNTLVAPTLTVGTVANPVPTLTWNAQWQNARAALNYVCDLLGAEWRINPAGTVDAGLPSTLWTVTPNDVITRRAGVQVGDINGIEAAELANEIDAINYASRVVAVGRGAGVAAPTATASSASPYTDYFGNTVVATHLLNAATADAATVAGAASAELARRNSVEQRVNVSSDIYDIGRWVRAGDWVYIWDPDIGLIGSGGVVTLQTGPAQPLTLRCYAHTWPWQRGMGAYYRTAAGVIVDLTDWVIPETGATVLEVGAPKPAVFPIKVGVGSTTNSLTERLAL